MNATLSHWTLETDADGLAWLTLDKQDASTNVLAEDVLDQFVALLERLERTPPRGLAIRSAKANGFIAGADVRAFTPMASREQALALIQRGQRAFDRLDTLPFPTLALIHGFCLGGGLELALACRYRIARDDDSTRLGLPEVRLGIHPGFGGSVRAVRLLGGMKALDLMLSGRTVSARQAKRLGLVDHAVPERHLRTAARETLLNPPAPHRPGRLDALSNHALARPLIAPLLKRKVAQHARPEHYPAPSALIDVWRKHADDPRKMLDAEAASVADLITGPTAQNLVRVFFLQERLKGLARAADCGIKHVHVIGAGVMGGDIAAWCAFSGMTVSLQDQAPERIAPAMGRAAKLYQQKLKDPRRVTAAWDRLIPDHRGRCIERADLVIEAIFEDKDVKQALYRDIEPRLRPDTLLASNTSSIPLEELAPALHRPERLVGLHFFNPVAKMQLVEIVRGKHSSEQAIQQAMAFTRAIDRLPLPVTSTPGFLVNRVLMPYLLEAVVLETEGVPAALIDRAAVDFGMPMGPIELADTVGLDVCLHVARILAADLNVEVPERLEELVGEGRLGRKNGVGFYTWRKGKAVKPHPEAGRRLPDDLTERMLMRLYNEARACLREGVVADADLLDAGMIFATGFAPFRGGPMHHAMMQGEMALYRELQQLTERHGSRFTPDLGWNNTKG
ncbi:MAG: enoyl-CoA hydratase/isomerase family protein [Gammaproteobacteria bacterium]|nr:enoyl-CoA hydratase/isomerase family protein [Gammaproteobacteria bacterium]